MTPSPLPTTSASGELISALAPQLARALDGLRFGAVELVVHDGKVVQIERRERLRLAADPVPGEAGRTSETETPRRPPDARRPRRENATGGSP